jgi:hypothetical protein
MAMLNNFIDHKDGYRTGGLRDLNYQRGAGWADRGP